MAICEVLGGNVYQKELAHQVVCHCANTLEIADRDLDIVVKVLRLPVHLGTDLYAYCEQLDHLEYQISLERTLSPEMFVEYLCHEMVHVMQYTQGTLKEVHGAQVPGTVLWMGIPVQEQNYDYVNQPWEAQAFELQESLSQSFFDGLKLGPQKCTTFRHLAEQITS